MPPKKKAKTWIMGPGGALIEKTAATAHAAPVSAAGGGARGPERLTDGLTSFTPAAVAMNMKGPAQSKKTAAAPWTAQRRRNQELSTVRSEIAAGRAVRHRPPGLFLHCQHVQDRSAQQHSIPGRFYSFVGSPTTSSSTVNNTNGVNESNAPAPSNTIQRPPGASATVPGGTPPVFALGQPITTTQTLPDATDPPQQSALSIAEKLRLKTASTLASVGVLPPTLNCIPGPKVGTSILLPGGFRDVLNELEPERAARPRYFELRGGMKQGKLRKAVAGVCDWIAPPGKIGLSPSVMRQLAVEAGEAVNIKELRLGACEKVVLEVSSAAMRGKGEDGLRDVVRQAWGGLACLGVDDVFREAGIRFKVTDTRPREVSCALPPKTANGEFNQFLQNQLEFRVKESTDAIKVVEMSATPGKAAFLRITSEDVVRVVASLDDSQTDPSSERSGKPLHHTGNLRLTAKKPQGTQLSSTLLYVTQGEELPTLSSFTWGGSNSVDIPIDGETIVCHVLPQGDPCTLHAHVLIKKQAAPSVQAEAFAQQSRPGSGFSEQSELILSYFQALSRVPSPVEVAARLPSGFELSYLTCFDELFGIERGSANGSISAQVSSFAPPHAAEWAEKLAGRLPSMPLHVRVPLALTLSPIELRKCGAKKGEEKVQLKKKNQYDKVTHVSIPKYMLTRTGHVDYVVEVRKGGTTWTVARRYTQFKKLHADLTALCPMTMPYHCEYGVIPVLCGSSWTEVTNQSPELIEKRRGYLEVYMEQLLVAHNKFYQARTALYSFLHDDEIPVNAKPGQTPLPGLGAGGGKIDGPVDNVKTDDKPSEEATRSPTRSPATNTLPVSKQGEKQSSDHGKSPDGSSGVAKPPQQATSSTSCETKESAVVPQASHAEMMDARLQAEGHVFSGSSNDPIEDRRGSAAHLQTDGSFESDVPAEAHKQDAAAGQEEAVAAKGTAQLQKQQPEATAEHQQQTDTDKGAEPQKDDGEKETTRGSEVDRLNSSYRTQSQHRSSNIPMGKGMGDEEHPDLMCSASIASVPGPSYFSLLSDMDNDVIGQDEAVDGAANAPKNTCQECGRTVLVHELAGGEETTQATTPDGMIQGGVPPMGLRQGASCASCRGKSTWNKPAQHPEAVGAPPQVSPKQQQLVVPSAVANADKDKREPVSSVASEFCRRPHWTDGGACNLCNGKFSFFLRKHHCRRCGKVFCGYCSAFTFRIPRLRYGHEVRVCKTCFDDLQDEPPTENKGTMPVDTSKSPPLSECSDTVHHAEMDEGSVNDMEENTDDHTDEGKEKEKEKQWRENAHKVLEEASDLKASDFELVTTLGRGTFGKVMKVRHTATGEMYAMKVLSKKVVHKRRMVEYIKEEKNILSRIDHPFIVPLYAAFQTDLHLYLANFSKHLRRSFVGSAEYLSPETLRGDPQTYAVDWWSVGVLLYEMLVGAAPFNGTNNNDVYQQIINKQLNFDSLKSETSRSVLRGFLTRDVGQRLKKFDDIRKHAFFAPMDWDLLLARKVKPPFVPDLSHNDTRYFSRDFTFEWATIEADQVAAGRATLDMLSSKFENFPHLNSGKSEDSPRPVPLHALAVSQAMATDPSDTDPTSPPTIPPPASVCLESFFGVWTLMSLELITATGQISYPWGSDVVGQAIYLKNGQFSLQITTTRASRSKFRDTDYKRVTREEMADAYLTYVGSFGVFTYEAGESHITHHSVGSLCPNWAEAEQKRYFQFVDASGKFDPEQLSLATGSIGVDGMNARTVMRFMRISEEEPVLPDFMQRRLRRQQQQNEETLRKQQQEEQQQAKEC
eukprot:gene20691-31882_t